MLIKFIAVSHIYRIFLNRQLVQISTSNYLFENLHNADNATF